MSLIRDMWMSKIQQVAAASAGKNPAPGAGATDLLDAPAIAARQRIANRMSDGFRQSIFTSLRGLASAPGTGLAPDPNDEPIITTMTGRELPSGVLGVDQAAAARAEAKRAAEEAAANLIIRGTRPSMYGGATSTATTGTTRYAQ